MAKEMKQNFGSHRSKSVTKPGSNGGSGGSSWGMSAIPALNNGPNPSTDPILTPSNCLASSPRGGSNGGTRHLDRGDQNDSSVNSNSNSEYSDIMNDMPPNCTAVTSGNMTGSCGSLRQRPSVVATALSTPKNHNYQFAQHSHHLLDEDPYGPMSSHFYTGASTRQLII